MLQERFKAFSNIYQVIINGIEYSVFNALVEFMYFGIINIPEDDLKCFLLAAHFFQIENLSYLYDKENFEYCGNILYICFFCNTYTDIIIPQRMLYRIQHSLLFSRMVTNKCVI